MKCQLYKKSTKAVFVLALLLSAVQIHANDHAVKALLKKDVHTILCKAEHMLEVTNKDAVERLKAFRRQSQKSLESFIDRNNNQSLKVHLENMQQDIDDLYNNFVKNPEYSALHPILSGLHKQLSELLEVSKQYIGRSSYADAMKFGIGLIRYEHLLPASHKRSKVEMLEVLYHRLQCK